jgi:predicted permease
MNLRWLRRRDRLERELEAEIRDHLERHVADLMAEGLSAEEARRRARVAFGGTESVKEECREARPIAWLDEVARDVRFAMRQLRRSPVVSATIVLSLALGVGGSTALFMVYNAFYLRALGVPKPQELVALSMVWDKGSNQSLPWPIFTHLAERTRTLSGLCGYSLTRGKVEVNGVVEPADGVWVTGNYFSTLGVKPAAGRLLTPDDDRPDTSALVISDAYWHRRFDGDPAAIGRTVLFNREPFVIVGILPRGFTGTNVGSPSDVFIPVRRASPPAHDRWNDPFATWLQILGRRRPDASLEEAQAELGALFRARAVQDVPRADDILKEILRTVRLHLDDASRGADTGRRIRHREGLRVLLVGSVVLLLIVSLNIGTVLLARGTARRHEMTVRLALGAGRARLLRQLATESLLFTTLGTAAGLALAPAASRLVIGVAFPYEYRLPLEPVMDARVLLFAAGSALAAALLFAIAPALRATRAPLSAERVHIRGARRLSLDSALMVTQVAFSVVLLVGAGLFVRSLGSLLSRSTGYDRSGILMFEVTAQDAGYAAEAIPPVYRRILERLAALPGVQDVSLSVVRPVSDGLYLASMVAVADTAGAAAAPSTRAALNSVGPGFFETLRIPIRLGRAIDARDGPGAPSVAVVSETMARTLFPEGDPLGRRLNAYGGVEIVGVVGDIRHARLKDEPRSVLYTSVYQHQCCYPPTFYLRTGDAERTLAEIRAVLAGVDRRLNPTHVATLDWWARASLGQERILAGLSTYFGALALVLVCLGLYGLTSYLVTLRVPELGLRLALGAEPRAVRALILGNAARLVALGLLLGLPFAYMAMRPLRGLVYDVAPDDPPTILAALVLVGLSAIIAVWWPARRAAGLDPSVALREG